MRRLTILLPLVATFFALAAGSMLHGEEVIIHAHPEAEYGEAIPYRKIPGSQGTLALEMVGDRLYALENKGLSVYDITDPKRPKRLGHVGGMGNVRQLAVRGKTAFLTSRQFGLWAVDVSDDTAPRILSNFDAVEMSTGLDVAGDIAFIGNRVYGIQCVDISDPSHMKHLSSYRTDESQSVYYGNGILFSGDWANGEVTVIDVSDVSQPKALSRIQLDGYGDGMAFRGNTLFASTGQHRKSGPEEERHGAGHGLDIFDISDPTHPVKLSKLKFPTYYFGPCDYWTPRLSGDYCIASDTVNGLFLIDISDLKQPHILGNLILPKADPENPRVTVPHQQIMDPAIPQGDAIASIAVGDEALYIAGNYTGIYLAEMPGVAQREPRHFGTLPELPPHSYPGVEEGFYSSGPELSNPTRGVAIHGDIAYTANVWDGVKMYRLSDDGIELIGHHPVEYAADIAVSGDRLYIAEGQNGLAAYRIESPGVLREIGRLPVVETGAMNLVQFVWAFEGRDDVAATCAHTKTTIVNFSDPATPRIAAAFNGSQLLYGSYTSQGLVKGRYLAQPRHVGGLMIFDLDQEPMKQIWYDRFPLSSQTGGATVVQDRFLVNRGGGYAWFDPEHPLPTTELPIHRFPGQTTLPEDAKDDSAISRAMFPKTEWEGLPAYDPESGHLALMNRIFKIFYLFDFSDLEHPQLLKKVNLHSNAYAPTFWKGRVVLPGAYSGLLLEK